MVCNMYFAHLPIAFCMFIVNKIYPLSRDLMRRAKPAEHRTSGKNTLKLDFLEMNWGSSSRGNMELFTQPGGLYPIPKVR